MMVNEFKQAVNAIIQAAVSDLNIPIYDPDRTEALRRPYIKTFVESGRSGRINADVSCRSVHTDIFYFASDSHRPSREHMDITDRLSYAFLDGITVDDTLYIPLLEDVEFSVEGTIEHADIVLHAEFDVEVYETVTDDLNTEMMENLNYTEREV